jgi:hypothetical protein
VSYVPPSPHVTFEDGPCENKTVALTAAQINAGITTCGGATYDLVKIATNQYTGNVRSSTTGGSVEVFAPDIFAGFHDLRHSVTANLWPALNAARRADQAALRVLSRRSKVKGR